MRYLIALGLIAALTSCMLAQKTEENYHSMLDSMYKQSVPLLKVEKLAQNQTHYVLLDTREAKEYEVSHINGALYTGYDQFDESVLKEIPKDQPIVVYCSVGYRSERIGEKLKAMGYQEVYNLYGGIFEWKNHGFPVVNQSSQTTEKVHTYNKLWGRWLFKGEKVY
ncbi:MAG: rhodanese-like domain-containing protein [Bacteroidota bacterium]